MQDNFRETLTTPVGTVLQAFEFLHQKYKKNLRWHLQTLKIPVEMSQIISDRALYDRFLGIYEKEKKTYDRI